MSYRWSENEEHLLRLMFSKNTIEEIFEEFKNRFDAKAPGFKHERTSEAIKKKCVRDSITKDSTKDYTETKNPYLTTFENLNSLQKKFDQETIIKRKGLIPENKIARKILTVSDIHFPFARNDLLKQILEEHADADICVINGDMLEGYAASRWPKTKAVSSLIEYQCAFEFVKLCSETFEHVYLVDGNHDIRTADNLKNQGISSSAADILRPNLLARIANGERLDQTGMLVEKLDFNNVHYSLNESWYVRIGKTIFAHPWNKGGSAPGYSVKKTYEYFRARYDYDDFDSIVIGHTHKIYKGIINSTLLIEQGCLATSLDYAFSPRMQYNSDNGMNGFAIVYQDKEGNTDFNYSGPIFLGEALPPKKSILI